MAAGVEVQPLAAGADAAVGGTQVDGAAGDDGPGVAGDVALCAERDVALCRLQARQVDAAIDRLQVDVAQGAVRRQAVADLQAQRLGQIPQPVARLDGQAVGADHHAIGALCQRPVGHLDVGVAAQVVQRAEQGHVAGRG